MPLTAVVQAKDIDGLLPAVDVRQPEKPFCLDGENFKWTVQGPESSFGSRYLTNKTFEDVELCETFRLGDDNEVVICGSVAIYKYDPGSMFYYPVYTFATAPSEEYPWFFCQILSSYYFCRKGVGIIEYNTLTNAWRKLNAAGIPANPVSIAAVRGRLVVLDLTYYQWSAVEDVDDFTLSLATGVGSQLLSLVGGVPFALRESVDGFLVFTSKGIISAEFNDQQSIFRHTVLTRQFKAINPFCIVDMDKGKQLFCDIKGFYTTDGQAPQPFQPLFGEYLNQTLLATRDLGDFSVFRMHINVDKQLLFFMVCQSSNHTLYEKSYCLHIPTQKWGSFDRLHYSFGEMNIGNNTLFDYFFGYFDENRFFQRFTGEAFNEITMLPDNGYFYHTTFDMPARIEEGIYYAPSVINLSADEDALFDDDLESGFYTFDVIVQTNEFQTILTELDFELDAGIYYARSTLYADANIVKIGPVKEEVEGGPLDAFILLGNFRFSELKFEDQMGEILHLSLHSGPLLALSEDWLVDSGEEDLLTSTLPDEDWGLGVDSGDLYECRLIGTNDGYTTFETHDKTLTNLAPDTERVKRYPGDMVKGLFHQIRIGAEADGHTFHIKTAELTGFSAGRIN